MADQPHPAPQPLAGRRVLLGVCGGIAAYRACDLARELMRRGASVQCVLTPHAARFVSALTFEALTGQPALVDEFKPAGAAGDVYAHLNLTRVVNCYVIAPLTAATLADLACGRAGNLLTACYLSCTAPVVIAPAMNVRMWEHAAVQANLAQLAQRQHTIVAPGVGALACGDEGAGRLAEVADIATAVEKAVHGGKPVAAIQAEKPISVDPAGQRKAAQPHGSPAQAEPSRGPLKNRRFIVTGGGTREYLDPVRFITNASTGTLALAVAEALLDAGAEVELIASELAIPPPLAHRLNANTGVRTAFDMQQAVAEALPDSDGLLMFAAVADYTPAKYSSVKRKKDGASWTVELAETQDILKSLAPLRLPGQVFVGVSLEDEAWLERAVKKAAAKSVELMLAVELGADLPFGDRRLHCALLVSGQEIAPPARRDKDSVGMEICGWLVQHFAGQPYRLAVTGMEDD